MKAPLTNETFPFRLLAGHRLIVVMDSWVFLLVGFPPTLSASMIFPQDPSILSIQDSVRYIDKLTFGVVLMADIDFL